VQTDKVLELIKQGADGWEEYVPSEVAAMIKDRCLFGFPCENNPAKKDTTTQGIPEILLESVKNSKLPKA
jgi:hypothetical protein